MCFLFVVIPSLSASACQNQLKSPTVQKFEVATKKKRKARVVFEKTRFDQVVGKVNPADLSWSTLGV